MARSLWATPAAVGLMLSLAGSVARAEPSQAELASLREMFNEARKAEDAGRWDEALTKLQAVAKMKMTPQVRFHLALCEENVGRLVEALNEFERARFEAAERGLSTVVVEAKKHAADVRARTAKLTLVPPPGQNDVRVEVDGQAVAALLLARPLLLDAGKHEVRATAPGFTFAKDVTLAQRQVLRLTLELVPAPSLAGDEKRGGAKTLGSGDLVRASPGGVSALADGPSPQAEPPIADRSSGARTAGWWLVAGGSAALAGSLASMLIRSAALAHIEAVCPTHEGCPRELESSRRQAQTSGVFALALGVAGGAMAATGVLLALTSRSPANANGVSWGPWLTAHGAGTTAAIAW